MDEVGVTPRPFPIPGFYAGLADSEEVSALQAGRASDMWSPPNCIGAPPPPRTVRDPNFASRHRNDVDT